MKLNINLQFIKKNVIIISVALVLAIGGILYFTTRTKASPSQIVDTTASTSTAYTGNRRILRTTSGTNGNRVFASIHNGTDQVLYYSDDADAASPTWSNVTIKTGSTRRVHSMVWDESNDVIYICYARGTLANDNTADVFYRRISNLGGSPPTLGAEQVVFDGSAGGTTYNGCHIEIAGDGGTTKVIVFADSGTAGASNTQTNVRAGTINSDTPTWTTSYTVKSWASDVSSGAIGVTRSNTNKLILFYFDGNDYLATRHDDSAAIDATSGWDALDGTDNSQTTISSDDPDASAIIANASVVGRTADDRLWFTWLDATFDMNTRSWNGTSLDPEMTPYLYSAITPGPAFSTDGTTLWLVTRNPSDSTQLVSYSRTFSDGTSPWNTSFTLLHDQTETVTYPNVSKKPYQGKLDVMYDTGTNDIVMHVSTFTISGNAYQESASSAYEGTTVWSECDGVTPNVSASIAGGTKVSTTCDASTGAYSLILGQPAAADSDITIFLDEDKTMTEGLTGFWKMNEASWNGTLNEVVDSSVSLKHGQAVGNATTSTTAKFDRAGTFDGTGDYVTLGDQTTHDIALPFTISAWIYISALPSVKGSDSEIISKYAAAPNRQWTFAIGTDDALYFWKSHNGTNGQYAFSTGYVFDSGDVNTWQHVAVVADPNGAVRLYVNGSQVDSGTFSDLNIYSGGTANALIGARDTAANYFQGNIDDVRMYNRNLTANEIAFMANSYDSVVGSNIKGAVFTHNNDVNTDITGITIYKDRSIIRSESSTSITNADINSYDQTSDIDIPLASNGTNVVADLGTKININSGDTYAPGGNVTTPKLHIRGTYTGASETLIIYGSGSSSSCDETLTNLRPLCIDGGTFTPSSNSTQFTASSPALIQNATYNTLVINPGANSVTHTLMAGTFTVNGALSFGNGTNTGVIITAATNSTTLTANSSLTIATNTTFVANGSNTTTVAGNWTNSGTFTHSSGTVSLAGADSSTQVIAGDTTFHNLSATTTANSAGRTIQYTGGSTTTVAGTWTMTGASGKILTLQSTNTTNWTISPTAYLVDYVNVARSTNTVGTICATHSTDSGDNLGWSVTSLASCGAAVPFTMQTGYYIGTGTDNFSITGVGFQPDMVLIKDDSTNGVDGVNFKTSAMSGEISVSLGDSDGNDTSDVIQSLDSDGFTVGTNVDVNSTNTRYTWIAFGGSDCTSTGTFCVGSYTGNGTSLSVTGAGFQPNLASVKGSGTTSSVFRTGDMPTNHTHRWDNGAPITNGSGIASLHSSGFSVGNSSTVNSNGVNYWFFAFKSTANIFTTGTFTGDGTDNRSISVGFTPQTVFIKNTSAVTPQIGYYNTPESNGDYSSAFGDASNATGVIKSLDASAFTVGTNVIANESGITIYWVAFGGGAAHAPSGTYSLKVGTYTGNGTSQTISSVGFRPDLVMIKDAAGATYAVWRSSMIKGDLTVYSSSSNTGFSGGITGFTSNGFTVGSNAQVNTNSTVYHYQAFGNAFNPEKGTGAADFAVGVYRGNLLDNRDIIRQPFQPDLVVARRSGGFKAVLRTSSMAGDLSSAFDNDAEAANYIQALNSDGFEVGTETRINDADENYYFFSFKVGPNFKVGNYSGTGSSQNITSPGITPTLVWVKNSAAFEAVLRPSDLLGDATLSFRNTAVLSDRITALISNGFTVGGNQTQTNTSGSTYRYAVWSVPPPSEIFYLNGINATGVNFN